MNLIKREMEDYRILLRNIPSLVISLFIVSVIMMNLLANKELISFKYLALDCGFALSWVSFLCMDMLCKRVEARKPDLSHNFYAMYTGDRSNGIALAEKFRAMGYDIPDEKVINVGAAIGSHVGPNACGMVYITND